MSDTYIWYQTLIKPPWAPPSWLFGPVWAFLYAIIAISFGFVFYKTIKGKLPWSMALPFALNLIFNFAFSPIQFGLKNNLLALLVVVFVVATLIWGFLVAWSRIRWVVYVNIPYLLWVVFASVLQATITFLNI